MAASSLPQQPEPLPKSILTRYFGSSVLSSAAHCLADKMLSLCCLKKVFIKFFGPWASEFVDINLRTLSIPLMLGAAENPDWMRFTVEMPQKMLEKWSWHEIIGYCKTSQRLFISAESQDQRKLSIWTGSPFVAPSWTFLVEFCTDEFVADFSAALSQDSNFIFCIATAHQQEQNEYSFYLYDLNTSQQHVWKLCHHSCEPLDLCDISMRYKYSGESEPVVSFYSENQAENALVASHEVTEHSRSAISNSQIFLIPDIEHGTLLVWPLDSDQEWQQYTPEKSLPSGYFDMIAYSGMLLLVEIRPPSDEFRSRVSKVIFEGSKYHFETMATLCKNNNSWVLASQQRVRETNWFKTGTYDVQCIDVRPNGTDSKKVYLSTFYTMPTLKQLATMNVQKLFSEKSTIKHRGKDITALCGGISSEKLKEKYGFHNDRVFS